MCHPASQLIALMAWLLKPGFERRASLDVWFLWCWNLERLSPTKSIIKHGKHTSHGMILGAFSLGVSLWDECSPSCSWVWTSVWLLALALRFLLFLSCFGNHSPITPRFRFLYRVSRSSLFVLLWLWAIWIWTSQHQVSISQICKVAPRSSVHTFS